jgi:hypothetical protein
MNNNDYDSALSFLTVANQYMALVESVAQETVKHNNLWVLVRDVDGSEITDAEYEKATRWSDHAVSIPSLFNFYHGIELLVKGFLLMPPASPVKAKHTLQKLCRQFAQRYSHAIELNSFIAKYTEEATLPAILADFLKSNGLTISELYQALRYPSDVSFAKLNAYADLKYKGNDGVAFFRALAADIDRARRAAAILYNQEKK